jgi:capsular polysaccharide export protein
MKHILFVGAPFGDFAHTIFPALERRNCKVWRVVFDGGDLLETPARNRLIFRNRRKDWVAFIRKAISDLGITTVIVFNDSLPYQHSAMAIAEAQGLETFAFENGYFRPHWITLERHGISARSRLPREIGFYRREAALLPPAEYRPLRSRLRPLVMDSINHYLKAYALAPVLPVEVDYYGPTVVTQTLSYTREYFKRKVTSDERTMARIEEARQKVDGGAKVFCALLQKPGDTQLTVHSRFMGNLQFIRRVLESFAEDAPAGSILIFKEHPLDFGVEGCPNFVRTLAASFGVGERVFFMSQTTIDVVLGMIDGLVTVNSTGGLGALDRGVPVVCLGDAFYDMPGLTHQHGLESFWTTAEKPSSADFGAFKAYVIATTQVNGGFHTQAARDVLAETFVDRLLSPHAWPHLANADASWPRRAVTARLVADNDRESGRPAPVRSPNIAARG